MPVNFQDDPRYRSLDPALVLRQYEVEKALRGRLLAAPAPQRAAVFLAVYDELFERCPWHPALAELQPPDALQQTHRQVEALLAFLPHNRELRILEIGCGMGELLTGLSQLGYDCTGLDVSRTRIEFLQSRRAKKLRFEQAEGTRLPFADASFDVVISIQLFEHLHPDDAETHLREVGRVLSPGGRYLMETPNRWSGPGDVSRFFSDRPEGFHLREYSIAELSGLFDQTGFTQVSVVRWRKNVLPLKTAIQLECLWCLLPRSLRRQRTFGLHNPLYIAQTRNHAVKAGILAVSTEISASDETPGLTRRPEFWNLP